MRNKNLRLFITGNRTGYSPEQCGRTMTVGELIAFLEQYDEDMKVNLNNDNGYTYGEITEDDFEVADYSEEDEDDE